MKNFLYFLLASLFCYSCSVGEGGEGFSKEFLPEAVGSKGEIVLVIDSVQYAGPVGEKIRDIFLKDITELPRPEPMFTLRVIDPVKLNSVLKGVKNLVFVTSLDSRSRGDRAVQSYFTKETLEEIDINEDMFLLTNTDVYARGQSLMFLFNKSQSGLVNKLEENQDKIRNHFIHLEDKRLKSSLFTGSEKGIQSALESKHNFSFRIPKGYQKADESENFIWLRKIEPESDKNIFVGYAPYTSEEQIKEPHIRKMRSSFASRYLFRDPDVLDSYVTIQNEIPLQTRNVNFYDRYAWEAKGLWKTNDNIMGGPFLSYLFVDVEQNRVYYIEGFLYRPGKSQREHMRELRVILNTFKTTLKDQAQTEPKVK